MDYTGVFSKERVKPTPTGGFQILAFHVVARRVDRDRELL